ncbi:hypothetical protein VKT23_009056 [Stygiomarasmius scandens]|uniref:C3H1-type domain-containing protein n=1 Tax=Marasmiellus scandens TaxID=2682957 RepID=A0ABR1JIW2_9AGAR
MDFSENHAQAPPCWDFMRGKCEHKNCKFTHPAGVFFSPHNRNSPFPPPKPLPLEFARAEENQHAYEDVFAHSLGDMNGFSPPAVFYKPIAWKTAPCRHFIRTGFCPMGDDCNFIHDLSLLDAAKTGKNSAQAKPNIPQNNPTVSHCWAYVQGKCRNSSCKYLHPGSTEPYKKYTPCVAWPLCPYGENCEFKHPEPLSTLPDRSSPTTAQPISTTQATSTSPVSPLSLPRPIYTAAPSISPNQPVYVAGPPSYGPQLPVQPNQQLCHPGVEINGTTYYNSGPFSPSFTSPTPSFVAPASSFAPLSPIVPMTPFLNANPAVFNHGAPFASGIVGPPPPPPMPLYPLAAPALIHPSEAAESWRNPHHQKRSFDVEPQNMLELHTAAGSPVLRSPLSWRNRSGPKTAESANRPVVASPNHRQNFSQTHHDEVYRADPRRRVGHTRRISVQVKNYEGK